MVEMLYSEKSDVMDVRGGSERRRSALGVGGLGGGESSWRAKGCKDGSGSP